MKILIVFFLTSLCFGAKSNYYLRYAKLMTNSKMFVGSKSKWGCPTGYEMEKFNDRVHCVSADGIELTFAFKAKKITEVMLKNPDDSMGCIKFEEMYSEIEQKKDPVFQGMASEFYCVKTKAVVHWYKAGLTPVLSPTGKFPEKVKKFTPVQELEKKPKKVVSFPVNRMSHAAIERLLSQGPNKKMTIILNKDEAMNLTSDFLRLASYSTLGPLLPGDQKTPVVIGMIAQDVVKDSVIGRIDIKPGDLLVRFDGMPLNHKKFSTTLTPMILVNLKMAQTFKIELLRNKDFLEVTYDFE